MTMWRALLPEMLMCSCSLNISGRSDSGNSSSSSFSFLGSRRPSVGGLARMGFTTPTEGMVTGMGGRAGVTPAANTPGPAVTPRPPSQEGAQHPHPGWPAWSLEASKLGQRGEVSPEERGRGRWEGLTPQAHL